MSKKILIISASPRKGGNSDILCDRFMQGAEEAGNTVEKVFLRDLKIGYCMACYGCRGTKKCVQKDDMQEVYPLLDEAGMIVLASPVYYHSFSGQLQCAINRIYALDKPKRLKKAALILSSGSDHVYSGAIFEYQNSFLLYLGLQDMGMFTAHGKENGSPEKLEELYQFGKSLTNQADKS